MKKHTRILIIILSTVCILYHRAYAHTTIHHLIDTGKSLTRLAVSPLKGAFVIGPKYVKDAYQYEVYGLEKPEKRGRLRNKLFAIYRAPAEETKGIIDGIVDGVKSGGRALKEFISIFFGD